MNHPGGNEKPTLPAWQERFARQLEAEDPRLPLIYREFCRDRESSVPRLHDRLLASGHRWTPSVRHLARLLTGITKREAELRP